MIRITHGRWSRSSIGVARSALKPGDNEVMVTFDTGVTKPGVFIINREDVISKYGVEVINNNGLMGVYIPYKDLIGMEASHG